MIERAYLHEAGHAVVAHRLHAHVHTVTVFGDREGATRFRVRRDAPLDNLTILVAGRSAAQLFGFDSPPSTDRARAYAAARQIAWPNLMSLDAVAEELVASAERRADRLVRENDREIAHFAGTLRAAGGRLAGREVDAAILAAYGTSWADDLPRLNRSSGRLVRVGARG